MKFWRILLIALVFSMASPVHASSLMDRVAYIEHELGIVPEEGSNIMTRLSAIEEYAGIEPSSRSVMDRVSDIVITSATTLAPDTLHPYPHTQFLFGYCRRG